MWLSRQLELSMTEQFPWNRSRNQTWHQQKQTVSLWGAPSSSSEHDTGMSQPFAVATAMTQKFAQVDGWQGKCILHQNAGRTMIRHGLWQNQDLLFRAFKGFASNFMAPKEQLFFSLNSSSTSCSYILMEGVPWKWFLCSEKLVCRIVSLWNSFRLQNCRSTCFTIHKLTGKTAMLLDPIS